MAEEGTGWGGGLWAAADLVTPMALRVAATLRLADHIAAGRQTTEALAEPAFPVRFRRERTLDRQSELADSAGLQFGSIVPAGSRSIIEFRPTR